MARAGAIRQKAELCLEQGNPQRHYLKTLKTLKNLKTTAAESAYGSVVAGAARTGGGTAEPALGITELAGASHAIRTPLTAMIGFADVMRQELFGPIENPQYRAYLSHICESGAELLEVLDRLAGLVEERERVD